MADRATINQRVQIGKETTPGTSVAAGKILECYNISFAPKPDVKTFRGTGRRYPSIQEVNKEWAEMKLDGNLDYVGMAYIAAGIWGSVTPVTHPTGTTAKDWVWTPAVSGSITPVTYTIEQGESLRAHKTVYSLITGFSYKGSRDDFSVSASLIGRSLQDNITMSASPTVVAMQPVLGSQVNLYSDTTSAGLGTTQFTKGFSIEYSYDNGYGPFWALNRTDTSFTGHVDLPPTSKVKLTVEADAAGMGLMTNLRQGDTLYLRVDAIGTIIETTIPYAMQHDMAIKLSAVDEFSDVDGVFSIGYEGTIVEDAAWGTGKAQVFTLTNLLTAL